MVLVSPGGRSAALLRGGLVALMALPASGQVLIGAAWTNTVQLNEPDEAVQIVNMGATSADVTGWRIEDDEGGTVVLGSMTLGAGERAWITHDALAFERAFGETPAAENASTDPLVPDISGTWPQLANTGDEILLVEPSGSIVDTLVYGDALVTLGTWTGAGASPGYDPAYTNALLLTRDRIEGSADCESDTDTAADWDDLRLERPGTTHLLPLSFGPPQRVVAAIGPDATHDLLAGVIEGARTSLRVGVYELRSPEIGALLHAAVARGVDVRVLLEGEVVGGVQDDARVVAQDLAAAGADVRWLRNDATDVKRYPFHHAKYAVADGAVTYVATENFGRTGHPVDGTYGNRGWSVRVDDPALAAWFEALFDEDSDLRHADVSPHDPVLDAPPVGYVPDPVIPSDWHRADRVAFEPRDVASVRPVVSPDHASLLTGGVLGLLHSATTRIDAEQLSIPLHWGGASDPPGLHPSLIVEELIAAARRGAAVRLLLDGTWYSTEPSDLHDNDDTCASLNAIGAAESLALSCRVLDPAWLSLQTIHVKGFLVDGHVAHVGSMNGTSSSYRLSREAALQLDSPSLVGYFQSELDRDWQVAGVQATVPAEAQGLRVAKSGAGLALSWDPRPAGSPVVSGWRIHAGATPSSETTWRIEADVASTRAPVAATPEPLTFFLVVAYATGPGGTIEGPSGWGDDYLDR
jgi:phosphatidylserine/phosphatidylglycerophosphate/cardiolipin synthase-like enzyme